MSGQYTNIGPGILDMCICDGTGWVTFNNQARRNAMSLGMWKSLGEVALRLEQDPDVRVVVMRGAGGKAFVSGDDVSEFKALRSTPEQEAHYHHIVQVAYQNLGTIRKPVVAVIEGACIGAGLTLALAADIRLAVNGARFGIPAAKIGLGVEYAGISRLARLVGPSITKDILFSARHMDTSEALRVGLINAEVSSDDLDNTVHRYIAPLLANAPLTMHCVKRAVALYESYSESIDNAKEVRALSEACYASKDYQEGITAFSEKRAPIFTGN